MRTKIHFVQAMRLTAFVLYVEILRDADARVLEHVARRVQCAPLLTIARRRQLREGALRRHAVSDVLERGGAHVALSATKVRRDDVQRVSDWANDVVDVGLANDATSRG